MVMSPKQAAKFAAKKLRRHRTALKKTIRALLREREELVIRLAEREAAERPTRSTKRQIGKIDLALQSHGYKIMQLEVKPLKEVKE